MYLRKIGLFLAAIIMAIPAHSAQTSFQQASQLLLAARQGNGAEVQRLIAMGVDVNYRDPSGMSLACTAIMNNDRGTAQLLQSFGADASRCDQEIRNFRRANIEPSQSGIFSGLSSTQSMVLAAGGAALGVGALGYLAGLYTDGNNNPLPNESTNRPGQGGGGGTTPGETITIPNAPNNCTNCAGDWATAQIAASNPATAAGNFARMSASGALINAGLAANPQVDLRSNDAWWRNGRQNYLLLNSYYDANARGYFGQKILRVDATRNPVASSHFTTQIPDTFGGQVVNAGAPVSIALITNSGITRSGNLMDETISGDGDTMADIVYAKVNGNGGTATPTLEAAAANRYWNLIVNRMTGGFDNGTSSERPGFNFALTASFGDFLMKYAGANPSTCTASGWTAGNCPGVSSANYTAALTAYQQAASVFNQRKTLDYFAGINDAGATGQALANFQWKWYSNSANQTDFINLFSINGTPPTGACSLTAVQSGTNCNGMDATSFLIAQKAWTLYNGGTIDGDILAGLTWWLGEIGISNPAASAAVIFGLYQNQESFYDDSLLAKILIGRYGQNDDWQGGYVPNAQLMVVKTGNGKGVDVDGNEVDIDYTNFRALLAAFDTASNPGTNTSTSFKPTILANAALPTFSKLTDTATADGLRGLIINNQNQTERENAFGNAINKYYNQEDNVRTPGFDALTLFNRYNTNNDATPMLIFGAGDYSAGLGLGQIQTATFENLAPWIWAGLKHSFMTAVAVQAVDGTSGIALSGLASYDADSALKIRLSQYYDQDGDLYRSRACGVVAGLGVAGGIDPWCFASPGLTSEQAVASLAGNVGLLSSAFSYMTMRQIFTLIAVSSDRLAMTAADLKDKYELPGEYQSMVDAGMDYKTVFAQVFGYGLANLQRATLPGSKVHILTTNGNIFSTTNSGNNSNTASWTARAATLGLHLTSVGSNFIQSTGWTPSFAFGTQLHGINAPMFDILESEDGTMSIPRIWHQSADFVAMRSSLDLLDNFQQFATDSPTIYDHEGVKIGLSQGLDYENKSFVRDATLNLDSDNSFADFSYKKSSANHRDGVLGLASDTTKMGAGLKSDGFSFGVSGFNGTIKISDALLDQSNADTKQNLGRIYGAQLNAGYKTETLQATLSAGSAIESDTILGAYGSGLLELGGSNSIFARFDFNKSLPDLIGQSRPLKISISSEVARTTPNKTQNYVINNMSEFISTAASAKLDWGNLSVGVALPLAVVHGTMDYLDVQMWTDETEDGYKLMVDASLHNINMANSEREVRLNAEYKLELGEFTTANLGAIYRINPNNTAQFGNESILMLKLSHKLGI
ncbi:MAG: ankyrin repeat domain-containing protein [Rickettsiales bacterium]|jgi:hypothetical protein|nr:ankyrin repeat domain-containing protein [Rickettsiales bacterium]